MTIVLYGVLASAAVETGENAREILAAYTRAQDEIRGFTVYFREEELSDLWVPHRDRAGVFAPGKRHEFEKGWFSQDFSRGRSIIRTYNWRIQDPIRRPIAEGDALYSIHRWEGGEYIQYSSAGPFSVICRAPEATWPYRENPVHLLALRFPGREAMGYILEDRSRLDGQLAGADLSLRRGWEAVGSSRCRVIDADTRFGRITAWFDPEKQHALAKCVAELTAGHLFQDRPIGRGPRGPEMTYRVEMTVAVFTHAGGRWLPAQARVLEHYTFPQGDYCTKQRTIELDRWFVNPDFEAIEAFELTDIPNDSMWRIDLERQNYLWNGGNLVPTNLSDLGYKVRQTPPKWEPRLTPKQTSSVAGAEQKGTGSGSEVGARRSGSSVSWGTLAAISFIVAAAAAIGKIRTM